MNKLQKYIRKRQRIKATKKLAKMKLAENQQQWDEVVRKGEQDKRMERD